MIVYYLSVTVRDQPPFPLLAELEALFGPASSQGIPLKFVGIYRSEQNRVMSWRTTNARTASRIFDKACKWCVGKYAVAVLEFNAPKSEMIEGESLRPMNLIG